MNIKLSMDLDALADLEAFVDKAKGLGAPPDALIEYDAYELTISFNSESV